MGRHIYIPRTHAMSEEEMQARFSDKIPRQEPTEYELRALQKLHIEVEDGIRHAREGDVQRANGTYASVKRKAQGMEYNNGVLDHLEELKSAMDAALDRKETEQVQDVKVEVISITCAEEEQKKPRPKAKPKRPAPEDDDRIPKPNYCGWEGAEKACGYK